MNPKSLTLAVLLSVAAAQLFAHEFWIDSKKFQVEKGENVVAYTRNGQNFKGIDLAYFTGRAALFERIDSEARQAVTPRLGDSPVFDTPIKNDGLFTLIFQSKPEKLTYREWAKFDKFSKHKAFQNVLERHRTRGLSEERI